MRRSVRARACGVALAAALATGCGGDEPASRPAARDTTPTDAVLARRATVKGDLFPVGWAQEPHEKGRSTCLAAVRRSASATAASHTFRRGSEQIQSAVYVYRSRAEATKALRRLTSAQLRRCYARESDAAYERGTGDAFEQVQAVALRVEGFDADAGGSRVRFSPAKDDPSIDVVVDLLALRVGRAVALELLIGSPTPPDGVIRERLARRHIALLQRTMGASEPDVAA